MVEYISVHSGDKRDEMEYVFVLFCCVLKMCVAFLDMFCVHVM